jgi:hypothetical protein
VKNQIPQITRNFKEAGMISRIPNHACSASQEKGHNKHLPIMHNLLEEEMREIPLYQDCNLERIRYRADTNIKLAEKKHVQRGPS